MDKRMQIKRAAWLRSALVLCAGVLLFAAAYASHIRWDWTEDQVYSLSASTKQVLKSLDEPVLIRAYMTPDMPQPYGRLKRFIADMLLAYHDAGDGNIEFEMVNPNSNANTAAALKALNVPKVQVRVIDDDRAQMKQGYMAVVLEYLDKKELIPVVQSESGFEYLLTRKIKKLTGVGRKKIGVVSGFGAYELPQLQRFASVLAEDYELIAVNPQEQAIDDTIEALIVAGVDQVPSESWRFRLDQFRMRQGGVLLLTSNAKPDLRTGFAVQNMDPYAAAWLKQDLHVQMEPGLVMDQRATRVTVNRQQGIYTFSSQVDYPFIPRIVQFSAAHVVSQGLEAVSMPFPSPLAVPDGADVLMYSSQWSAVQDGPPFDVNPMLTIPQRFAGLQLHDSIVGWAYEGEATSSFKAVPKALQEQDEPVQLLTGSTNSRLLVLGSAAMLNDEFLDGSTAVLVLNALDWLVRDEALISLRSRGVSERPLQQLESGERDVYKFFWMFGPSLLVLLLGIWRWRRIKRRSARVSA